MRLIILGQPTEKQIALVNAFRVDERQQTAIAQLKSIHGVAETAEYFRGLIYLDALLLGELPEDSDCPHWVRRAYPHLFHRKAA